MDGNRPIDERSLAQISCENAAYVRQIDELSRRIDGDLFGSSPTKEPELVMNAECLKVALLATENALTAISNRLRAIANRLREPEDQLKARAEQIAERTRPGLIRN